MPVDERYRIPFTTSCCSTPSQSVRWMPHRRDTCSAVSDKPGISRYSARTRATNASTEPVVTTLSAERERVGFHSGVEELDLKQAIDDRSRLPYQLVHPRFGNGTVAAFVHVEAVSGARWLAVDGHA